MSWFGLGGAALADVTCEIADSPSGDGKSIMSEEIDEVARTCTADKFLETLEKDFLTAPSMGAYALVCTVDFKQTPTEDGQVNVVLTVSSPMGAFKQASKIKVDRVAGIVSRANYLDSETLSESSLDQISNYKVHRAPFRVEGWVDQVEVRDSSEMLCPSMQMVLDGVMGLGELPSVKLDHSVDSPSSPGLKSLLSQPLDESMREKFWDLWEKMMREFKDEMNKTTIECTDTADGFSEIQFSEDGQKVRFRKHVKDLDNDTWSIHRYKEESMTNMYDTFVCKLHMSPLVVEMYVQGYAGRLAEGAELATFTGSINDIIKKAQPGWFSS